MMLPDATRTGHGRIRTAVRHALVLAACVGSAAAYAAEPGAFEKGVDAYEHQDYRTALKLIQPLAESGEVEAQYFMGTFYLYGTGVPLDPITADTWFRRAYDQWLARARGGDSASMVEVAMMLNAGVGVERDDAEAVSWLRKASEMNSPEAWAELGNLYLAGEGVPRDRAEATRWYQKAAAAGNAHAVMVLKWLEDHPDDELAERQLRYQSP